MRMLCFLWWVSSASAIGLEFGRLIVNLKADADALPAAKAILEGLKERYERTGSVSKLIHTVSCFRSFVDSL